MGDEIKEEDEDDDISDIAKAQFNLMTEMESI